MLRTAAASATATLEDGIFAEMNLARSAPKEYAKLIVPRLAHYTGKNYKPPGAVVTLVTQEGACAVEDAVSFLNKQLPVQPFERMSVSMTRAARDHVLDTGPKGLIGHTGSDGSSPFDRLDRYGRWTGSAGDNISYGNGAARDMVIQLIVDDGVPDRGHRLNIFSPNFAVGECARMPAPAHAQHADSLVHTDPLRSRHRRGGAQAIRLYELHHICGRLRGGYRA